MARKILLADDSVTAQNMGRKILADAGYDVITVNNGSAALKKIAELKPELIILDVYMPGYSGLEVCQRLKDAPETARVPVLLSVGKLEPFKPDEAKRVRAEGYIVKPFEASELLSALSKLEDKIVPKAEAGKPGRLNRAVAGVSESSGDEPVAEGSWKDRISFPGKKKETAQESPDDGTLYNAVNRDLKTVVQHDTAKIQSAPVAEAHQHETLAAKPEEKLADLGALATAGLPKDVTTEEIAALAAAAAHVQGRKLEAESTAKAATEEVKAEEKIAAPQPTLADVTAQTTQEIPEAQTAPTVAAPTEDEVSAAIARLEQEQVDAPEQLWNVNAGNGAGQSCKEDLPVTMAAPPISETAEVPRWTAVPVAVDAQETALSLEREMQLAFRAFSTAAAAQAGPATLVEEPQTSAMASAAPEAVTELVAPVVATAEVIAEPAPVASAEIPVEDARTEVAEFAVAQGQEIADHSEQSDYPVAVQPARIEAAADGAVTENATAEAVVAERAADNSVEVAVAHTNAGWEETQQEPVCEQHQPVIAVASEVTPAGSNLVSSETVSVDTASIEEAANDVTNNQAPEEQQPAVMAEAPVSEIVQVSPEVPQNNFSQDNIPQRQVPQQNETELAATTAAAWASWRQIRDSVPAAKTLNMGESTSADGARDSAPLAANALAVAAGAEKSPSEASASLQAKSAVDSQTVASIVDSLLAELRPKIVEEISRKLAAEKK